jgi:uncharacterized LabA/DUF88 family protein
MLPSPLWVTTQRDFFYYPIQMNRTTFLIDGFNLYHSLNDACRHLRQGGIKWLNIHKLCNSYIRNITPRATLEQIYYFSAFAYHRQRNDPQVIRHHKFLIECLKATGVNVEMGRFKAKKVYCNGCKTEATHYEEKETDVAISVKLLELFHLDQCDTAVLVTGDTDLGPAIRTAFRLFPGKQIYCLFPYGRKNNELAKIATDSFLISTDMYQSCQFDDPFVTPEGKRLRKHASW